MRSLLASFASVLLGTASVFGAAGDLDPSFNGGRAVVGEIPGIENGRLFAVARQPDGKLVAAGYGESEYISNNPLIVLRYLPDGVPDPSFGTAGAVVTSLGGFGPRPRTILVQPDGKFVVVASVSSGATASVGLARFEGSGTLDPTFGSGGTVLWSPGQPADTAGAVLDPDGSIVVAGDTSVYGGPPTGDVILARFSPNGSLDASFGVGGVSTLDIAGGRDEASALVRQANGQLVVAGFSWADPLDLAAGCVITAARFDPDGSLDATFGTGGVFQHTFGKTDEAMALLSLPDDRLFVAGRSFTYEGPTTKSGPVFFLRLTTGGTLDGTFGVGGVVWPERSPDPDTIALAPAADRVVVLGVLTSASVVNLAFGVGRFHLDGTPDADFGDDGLVSTPLVTTGSIGMAGLVQPDGRVVEVGLTTEASLDEHPPYFIEYYPAVARFLGDVPLCATDADCGACERCSVSGTCVWGARTVCTGAVPGGARVDVATPGLDPLDLAESFDRRGLRMRWRGATPLGFDPMTTDDVGICLFADGSRILRAIAPAGGSCAGRPCWRGLPGVAVTYADKEGSPEGITTLRAKGSLVKVRAAGAPLDGTIHSLPLASFLPASIVMQVHAGGACLGATLSKSKLKFGSHGIIGTRLMGE